MPNYPEEFKKEVRPELSVFPGVTMTCGDLTATCDDYDNFADNASAAIDEIYLKWKKKEAGEGES